MPSLLSTFMKSMAPLGWASAFLTAAILRTEGAEIAAGQSGYDSKIKVFFESYCTKCHNPEKKKGKLILEDIDPDMLAGPQVTTWQKVFEQLELGDMPPEDEDNLPDETSRREVLAWIANELRMAGKEIGLGALLDHPSHGNRVDHDALFSGKHQGPAWSPTRLWRISPFISEGSYQRTKLGKHIEKASQPFGLSDEEGLKDYASRWQLDGPTLELLLLNADQLITNQIGPTQKSLDAMDVDYRRKVATNPKFDEKKRKAALRKMPSQNVLRWSHKELRAFAFRKTPTTEEEMEVVITAQYQLALSRPPTDHEMTRVMGLLSTCIKEGGNLEGLRAAMTAILLSPEAIYRMELGMGKKTSDGRRMLSAMELAFALSYALRDSGPDKDLMASAMEGTLTDRAEMAKQAGRMIDEELHGNYRRTQSQRIFRFFREYFGYDLAPEVFKDGSRHPNHSPSPRPDSLVGDTDQLVRHIVTEDKNVLRELLTTNKVFIVFAKAKAFRRTTPSYNVSMTELLDTGTGDEQGRGTHSGWRWLYDAPKNQRAGILTQPSWLTAHSGNFDNDPVKRGKWIYERLLCGVIPDVPITVDAVVPEDHDKPLRARFEKTRESYCWRCHQKMNPLGMAFEMYDDVGRYREKELLRDNKTEVPVDASGAIMLSGAPGLDGRVENAIDLMHKLADSPRVRQSFVRHAFRFWMGRNETLDDSPTLMAADNAFAESGSFKALVISLLTSDSFLYRRDK